MPWTPWAGLVLEQPGRLGYSLIIFDPKGITGGSASCSTAPPIRELAPAASSRDRR